MEVETGLGLFFLGMIVSVVVLIILIKDWRFYLIKEKMRNFWEKN